MENLKLVGSFLLGLLCASLISNNSGTHDSLVFAQTTSTEHRNPYMPIVRPLGAPSLFEGNESAGREELDGRTSFREAFLDGSTIVYGGGPYELHGAVFQGKVNIELVGAAANTAQFLQTFGFLVKGPVVPNPSPTIPEMNTPIHKAMKPKSFIKGDFVSPYGGKQ